MTKNAMPAPIRARTATPPTTPPTIAPVLFDEPPPPLSLFVLVALALLEVVVVLEELELLAVVGGASSIVTIVCSGKHRNMERGGLPVHMRVPQEPKLEVELFVLASVLCTGRIEGYFPATRENMRRLHVPAARFNPYTRAIAESLLDSLEVEADGEESLRVARDAAYNILVVGCAGGIGITDKRRS
jgi:hypothetical protein